MTHYTSRDIAAILGDRHVLVHVSLVRACGTLSAGVLMSQLLYWHMHGQLEDGRFWLTMEALREQTGMDRRECETARKRLVEMGLIEVTRQGLPCTTWYRVNVDAVVEAVVQAARDAQESSKAVGSAVQTSLYAPYDLDRTDRTNQPVRTVRANKDKNLDETLYETHISPPNTYVFGPPQNGGHVTDHQEGKKPRSSPFKPPTAEEQRQYGLSIGMSPDLIEACRAYYEANGWKVGRNPMKDWKAAMRYWHRSHRQRQKATSQQEQLLSLLQKEERTLI